MTKKNSGLSNVRSNELLCNNSGFLKQVIKAQARLLVAYRIGGKPPEWVFDTIDKAQKAGIEC